MIDRAVADEIARREVAEGVGPEGIECVLLERDTLERPFGWVYFYNSREYAETGDTSRSLTGNSPFIVDRADGKVEYLGTHRPAAVLLEEYEKTRAAAGPPPGWHPDPWSQARLRYWDGERWTGHTAP